MAVIKYDLKQCETAKHIRSSKWKQITCRVACQVQSTTTASIFRRQASQHPCLLPTVHPPAHIHVGTSIKMYLICNQHWIILYVNYKQLLYNYIRQFNSNKTRKDEKSTYSQIYYQKSIIRRKVVHYFQKQFCVLMLFPYYELPFYISCGWAWDGDGV